jgi:cellulose biosynthesis protein BcsQ
VPGSVVTFYSYKGGVGRSFALANVAVILAQWGYRVLAIDWDIEAPGLVPYFTPSASAIPAGVLDFLSDCARDAPGSWDAYAGRVNVPGADDRLFLMPAFGSGTTDFEKVVQRLDWDALYAEHDFGNRIENLRAAWIEHFDLVLIDSRTGLTDFIGLTTAQLPDILAFLFTANEQSLDGCSNIARRAMEARRNLAIDRPALVPLPIPAKFDQGEEYDRAKIWRGRFAKELAPFFDTWASSSFDRLSLVDHLTIPYQARWSFGEDLAAVLEPASPSGTRTPGLKVSYALETIAAIFANGFKKVDLLWSSRNEFVLAAQTAARDRRPRQHRPIRVFVSAQPEDYKVARDLCNLMETHDIEPFFDDNMLTFGDSFETITMASLDNADAFLVLVGDKQDKMQQVLIEQFLRSALRSNLLKPIIPLLMPGRAKALRNSRLADFHAVQLDPRKPLAQQLGPVLQRLLELRDITEVA